MTSFISFKLFCGPTQCLYSGIELYQIFSPECVLCRKTPNDIVEAHPSNIETAAHLENIQQLPSPSQTPSVEAVTDGVHHVEAVMERAHHGGGWLLSGIICMNILIVGCALVSGSAISGVITTVHQQIFIIILLLLTMLWMFIYTVFTSRKDEAQFKDSHAGAGVAQR